MRGPHTYDEGKVLTDQLNNSSISAETKIKIIQCAVAKCPKVCISAHGIQIPSLLDSSSKMTLLQQSCFDKHILSKINLATGEKANAHNLFKLTVANDRQMPINPYHAKGYSQLVSTSAKCNYSHDRSNCSSMPSRTIVLYWVFGSKIDSRRCYPLFIILYIFLR